jgi:hypothetical protein
MAMGFAAFTHLRIARRAPVSGRDTGECRNKRPSFIRREFEAAACGGGGAVVAARSKFDAAIHDPEIEPMDEAAIATLLTKVSHARPGPFAI